MRVLGLLLSLAATASAADRDPFHSAEQLNARLAELAARHPARAHLVTLTTTPEGRAVQALEIDLDEKFAADAPVLLLQGGIHGNEWISTEVVLRLVEVLLASDDPRLHGLRYHAVPSVNLDGFARGIRSTVGDGGKLFDGNRDFPVPFQADFPSNPVIQSFRDYARRPGAGRLAAVLDYHSAAECVMWPWAFTRDAEPAQIASLKKVTEEMARSTGYCFGQTSKMIPYKHQGTAQDWFQHFTGVPSLLVELSSTDSIDHPQVDQVLLDQERAFRIFVRWLKARGR